mgnify:CR=1 FL=1
MSDSQSLIIKGHVDFKLYNQYGEVIDERAVSNALVQHGRGILLQKTATNFSSGDFTCDTMAIGTGTGGTTGLVSPAGTQVTTTRVAAFNGTTVSWPTTANQMVVKATFGPNNPSTSTEITEAAMGYGGVGNIALVYAYTSFGKITKRAADTLGVTWTITITAT